MNAYNVYPASSSPAGSHTQRRAPLKNTAHNSPVAASSCRLKFTHTVARAHPAGSHWLFILYTAPFKSATVVPAANTITRATAIQVTAVYRFIIYEGNLWFRRKWSHTTM